MPRASGPPSPASTPRPHRLRDLSLEEAPVSPLLALFPSQVFPRGKSSRSSPLLFLGDGRFFGLAAAVNEQEVLGAMGSVNGARALVEEAKRRHMMQLES
ncbi:hypothetical protein OPV22_017617 [Ensete ventricosum]|uniref:Uncharacterized protein n=1 Tax=Ensete ventricosum TaxID=4639 RepID=A0AAV8QSH5_ENSVE|nr:hypothetical protein OPV22_017617 [Ensete ventricosum]